MNNAAPEQKQVYSFLQKALDRQQEQGNIMKVMLDQMQEIENSVKSIEGNVRIVEENVQQKFEAVTALVEKVQESVTLNDAECFEIQSEVHGLSNEFAKEYFSGEDVSREEFSKRVGMFRRGIWKRTKEKFQVAKYSHIRRIDFKAAKEYVGTIKMRDFIDA